MIREKGVKGGRRRIGNEGKKSDTGSKGRTKEEKERR